MRKNILLGLFSLSVLCASTAYAAQDSGAIAFKEKLNAHLVESFPNIEMSSELREVIVKCVLNGKTYDDPNDGPFTDCFPYSETENRSEGSVFLNPVSQPRVQHVIDNLVKKSPTTESVLDERMTRDRGSYGDESEAIEIDHVQIGDHYKISLYQYRIKLGNDLQFLCEQSMINETELSSLTACRIEPLSGKLRTQIDD
jgi:hypothetical protein